jgi:carbamoyltransferase
MRILGISAFYHDSAAALIEDGEIVAAAQEERFSRVKHDARFPTNAMAYCLEAAGAAADSIDHIAFYDKPFLKFERLLETYVAFAPRGFRSFRMALPVWLKEKLFQKRLLRDELRRHAPELDWEQRLLFAEHHQSHAASAFFPSPFEEAVVLTMDGVGEWATTSAGIGRGNSLEIIKEIHFPHSLGLLYSAFTYYTGFRVNSGEYKVMGLAPYGEPKYAQAIFDNLIDLKDDGSFRLDLSYFDYCTGLTMTNGKFDALFGGPPRDMESLVTQRHMDLAASVQAVLDEAVLRLTRSLAAETGIANLCLAGGVALNCVANGRVLRDGHFDNVWIQPAAGDAGGALGAALAAYHQFAGQPRTVSSGDSMKGSYLGPAYDQPDIERRLTNAGARFTALDDHALLTACAEALAADKAVGWFQGRMEFGPRALGGRSILGDARSATMQSVLNLKVKYRESFRPFAPSVLSEDVAEWFELDGDSPYMLLVADVAEDHRRAMSPEQQALFGIDKLNVPRSDIPAVTHVDYSARIQTVHRETNPRYYGLIERFKALTGCPMIVNTSFNVRGEPIVGTPEDAFRCFMGTGIEVLAIGNCLLVKEDQDPALATSYETEFAAEEAGSPDCWKARASATRAHAKRLATRSRRLKDRRLELPRRSPFDRWQARPRVAAYAA